MRLWSEPASLTTLVCSSHGLVSSWIDCCGSPMKPDEVVLLPTLCPESLALIQRASSLVFYLPGQLLVWGLKLKVHGHHVPTSLH